MALATKEEERNALAKIRKIVEDLGGEDSYLGMTFKGCFEQAEENIENDWGCCYKDSYDDRCREVKCLIAHKNELEDEVKNLKAQVEDLEVEKDKAEAEVENYSYREVALTNLVKMAYDNLKDMLDDELAEETSYSQDLAIKIANICSENKNSENLDNIINQYIMSKKVIKEHEDYLTILNSL